MPSRSSRVAAKALELLPRQRISRGVGRIADAPASGLLLKGVIGLYSSLYRVDLSEALVPEGGYKTFDEFFTRRLVSGARSVATEARTLVSPSDGKVEDFGPIEEDASFLVKGKPYDLGELLGDPSDVDHFLGGHFCIIYLSPRDYHRVHAPVSGPVEKVRHVGGTLYPVNSFGLAHFPKLFAKNERVAVFQRTGELGADAAPVVTIMVGAIGVGRISLSFDSTIMTNVGRAPTTHVYGTQPELARGDELGIFHLGSTAIVLTPPSVTVTLDVEPGQMVRMGQVIGHTEPTSSDAEPTR